MKTIKMNEVNVIVSDGRPIRVIPRDRVCSGEGKWGDWRGWEYAIYLTQTGKYLAVVQRWTFVDGEADGLLAWVGSTLQGVYDRIDWHDLAQAAMGMDIAEQSDVTPIL